MHQPTPIAFNPRSVDDLERLRNVLLAGLFYYDNWHDFDTQIYATIDEINELLEDTQCAKYFSQT